MKPSRDLARHATPALLLAGLGLALAGAVPAQSAGCGDCDGDGSITIIDALEAARIGAQLVPPTPAQDCDCDVNSDNLITVIDALGLAQRAASLPVSLVCPAPPCGSNNPPAVTILSPVGGIQAGNVLVTFDTQDLDGDPLDLLFEHSTDLGVTFSASASTGGGTVPVNPALGIPPAAGLTFEWDSAAQVPGVSVPVEFRVTADDGRATASDTVTFLLDNTLPPPYCSVTTPSPSVPAGNVVVSWQAVDFASVPVDLLVEFSTNGGGSWEMATEGPGSSGTSSLPASPPPGTAHTFVWRSDFDGVGLGAPSSVILQLRVINANGASFCATAPFPVSN